MRRRAAWRVIGRQIFRIPPLIRRSLFTLVATIDHIETTTFIVFEFSFGRRESFVGEIRGSVVVKGNFETSLFAGKKRLPYCWFNVVGCTDCGEQIVDGSVILCSDGLCLKIEDVAD